MTTSRIKDKLSQLVGSQLPEFIRSDFPTFVEFIEAYYKFLEQDQSAFELIQNATNYADVDLTTSSFINYFLTNYAKDFPTSALVNKRFFIKKIKDLYESKGSELSFKLLFQILYGEEAHTSHPYDLVLRASDGQWVQRLSVRVNLVSGSTANLTDKLLTYVKNGITYTDQILRVRLLENGLYEIFIPSTSSTPFELEDDVFVGTFPNYDFLGTIEPTTSTLDIIDPGSNFKPGTIFNVTILGGTGTLIKIVKTNSDTGIATAKIINYGYGYASNTNIVFDLINGLGVSPSAREIASNTGGFFDSIVVASPQGSGTGSDYFAENYVEASGGFISFSHTVLASNVYGQIGTSVTEVLDDPTNVAVLRLNMGALARYPGEYRSSQGFISEPDVRLPDDKLYQPFAYQVSSNLDIETFYDIVKKLIHPAGTNLFSNRTLTNSANIRSNINVITRSNILIQLHDTFGITDAQGLAYNLTVSDNFSLTDFDYTKTMLQVSGDSVTMEENSVITLVKDDSFTLDDNTIVTFATTVEDSLSTNDESNLLFSAGINNAEGIVTLTETVSGILRNYVEVHTDYFAEDYTQETVITV